MLKENKGITLVALIITIIVMLILAGVSISLVLGQNGVLTQAQNSKKSTQAAAVNDGISMGSADAISTYYATGTGNATVMTTNKQVLEFITNNISSLDNGSVLTLGSSTATLSSGTWTVTGTDAAASGTLTLTDGTNTIASGTITIVASSASAAPSITGNVAAQ